MKSWPRHRGAFREPRRIERAALRRRETSTRALLETSVHFFSAAYPWEA
jgi:hypothetical protein